MTDLEIRPEKLNGKYGEKTDQKSNDIVERVPHLFGSTIYFALYKRKKKINFGVIKKQNDNSNEECHKFSYMLSKSAQK